MKIHYMEQLSDEWFDIKRGKITASAFGKVLAKGQGITRRNYMYGLIAERISNQSFEKYTNDWMEEGVEKELQAVAAYEMKKRCETEIVGYVEYDEYTGCSPDRFVDDNGGLEIKCPKLTTHIETLITGKMPNKYKPQVQGCLFITKRAWWDFVSFYPDFHIDIAIYRQYPDENYIEILKEELDLFKQEMLQYENQLKSNLKGIK